MNLKLKKDEDLILTSFAGVAVLIAKTTWYERLLEKTRIKYEGNTVGFTKNGAKDFARILSLSEDFTEILYQAKKIFVNGFEIPIYF